MIFVTVGVQLPFDRMIKAIDEWSSSSVKCDIFAQIGNSQLVPDNIEFKKFLKQNEANDKFNECSLVVSHAGMGSILSALKSKKPIIIMPRLAKNNEHRNDHQLATAKWVEDINGVYVAWDTDGLIDLLDRSDELSSGTTISDYASDGLIDKFKTVFSDRRNK